MRVGVAFMPRLLSFQRAAFTKIPYRNCGKRNPLFYKEHKAKSLSYGLVKSTSYAVSRKKKLPSNYVKDTKKLIYTSII